MKRQTLFIMGKSEEPYYEFDVKLETKNGFIIRRVLARNEQEAKQNFINPNRSTFMGTLTYS